MGMVGLNGGMVPIAPHQSHPHQQQQPPLPRHGRSQGGANGGGPVNNFTPDEISDLLDFAMPVQPGGGGGPPSSNSTAAPQPPIDLEAVQAAVAATTSSAAAAVASQPGRKNTSTSTTTPQGSKHAVRSERKRSREKQRREDVNKQFTDLTDVIKKLEADELKIHQELLKEQEDLELLEQGSTNKRPRTAGVPRPYTSPVCVLPPFSPTNRVDLIARTILHLERLSHVTKKQKTKIASLEEQILVSQQAGEAAARKLKQTTAAQAVTGLQLAAQYQHTLQQLNSANTTNTTMNTANAANTTNSALAMNPLAMNPMLMNPMMQGMLPGGPQQQPPPMMMMMPNPTVPGGMMMMPALTAAQMLQQQQQQQQPGPATTGGTPVPTSTSTNGGMTGIYPQKQQQFMMMMPSMTPQGGGGGGSAAAPAAAGNAAAPTGAPPPAQPATASPT